MGEVLQAIASSFQDGCTLKERARSSLDHFHLYLPAAKACRKAAYLSENYASSQREPLRCDQSSIFASYYRSEAWACLRGYRYELHHIPKALHDLNRESAHLGAAIRLTNAYLDRNDVPDSIREHLSEQLRVWRFFELNASPVRLLLTARSAWDAEEYIKALDQYRRAEQLYEQITVAAQDSTLNPAYERIARGNAAGMRANIASSLLKIAQEQSGSPLRPYDDVRAFIARLAEGYEAGRSAYDANPEWEQYLLGSRNCMEGLKLMLQENGHLWDLLVLDFADRPVILSAMREIDPGKVHRLETQNVIEGDKGARLWSAVAPAIFLFVIPAAIVFGVLFAGLPLWTVFVGIILVEGAFLLLGAFVLRSVGNLSEEGFLYLIRLALRQQLKPLRRSLRRSSTSQ